MTRPPLVNPFLHVVATAKERPRDAFVRSSTQTISNSDAVVLIRQIAYEMRRLGVKAGDVVATEMPDALGALFTMAIFHEGAVGTVLPREAAAQPPINVAWHFTTNERSTISGAHTVLADDRFLRQIQENPAGISPSDAALDPLRIAFSSGTTGTPKAIGLRRSMELAMDAALPTWFRVSPIVNLMGLDTASGIGELFLSMKAGQPYIAAGNISAAEAVDLIVRTGARKLTGSVAQVAAVMTEATRRGENLQQLDLVQTAGTALPSDIASQIQSTTGGCMIIVNYGSTEAGAATVRTYPSDDPFDAGHPVPGSQLEIVDDEDQPLPAGTTGHVRHRAPGMVDGYLGSPEATASSFRDGWFYPGDLGFLRPDGGLTLAGRSAEIINAGGVKIDPVRIDHTAAGFPGVTEACAFPLAGTDNAPAIAVAVVANDDADLESLARTLQQSFGFAAPSTIVRVDQIERTATGKPLRRVLTERFTGL